MQAGHREVPDHILVSGAEYFFRTSGDLGDFLRTVGIADPDCGKIELMVSAYFGDIFPARSHRISQIDEVATNLTPSSATYRELLSMYFRPQ